MILDEDDAMNYDEETGEVFWNIQEDGREEESVHYGNVEDVLNPPMTMEQSERGEVDSDDDEELLLTADPNDAANAAALEAEQNAAAEGTEVAEIHREIPDSMPTISLRTHHRYHPPLDPREKGKVQNPVHRNLNDLINPWVPNNLRVISVHRLTKLTKAHIGNAAQKFLSYLVRSSEIEDFDVIVNADEVPMSVSGTMTNNLKTIAGKDDDGDVDIDPQDLKRTSSVLAFAAITKKKEEDKVFWTQEYVPPVIMFPGDPPKQDAKKREVYSPKTKVIFTKKAVITSSAMKHDVLPHLIAQAKKMTGKEKPKVLFIMDLAPGHKTVEVIDFALANNVVPGFLPAGCTAWLQWVDVYCAAMLRRKVFNSYLAADPRIKRTAGERRILTTTLIGDAMKEIAEREQVVTEFKYLGYLRPQDGNIKFRFNEAWKFKCPNLQGLRQNDQERAQQRDENAAARNAAQDARLSAKPKAVVHMAPGQQSILVMMRSKRNREDQQQPIIV